MGRRQLPRHPSGTAILSMQAPIPTDGHARRRRSTDLACRKKRMRHLRRSEWQVLIKEHYEGYIDWRTYEANPSLTTYCAIRARAREAIPG